MGYTKVFGYPHLLFPGIGPLGAGRRPGRAWWPWWSGATGWPCSSWSWGPSRPLAMIVDPASKLYNVRFLPLLVPLPVPPGRLRAGRGGGGSSPAGGVAAASTRGCGQSGRGSARSTTGPGHRARRVTRFRRPTPAAVAAGAVVGPLVALAAACLAVVPPLAMPASTLSQDRDHRRRQPAERLGGVELLGLRAQARLPRVPGRHPDDGRGRRAPRAAAGRCGSTTRPSTGSGPPSR